MTKLNWNIRVDSKTILKAIKKIAENELIPKILKIAGKESIDDLRQILIQSIQRTKVMKELMGEMDDATKNMRVHLGLTDYIATAAADEIESAIEDSINKFNIIVNKNSIVYKININNLNSNILKIPSASYISTNSDGDETVIPWMEWLINGSDHIDADILFVTDFIYEESRSGQALMVHEGSTRFGGWDIDKYNKFAKTTTFINDALEDNDFISDSIKILNDNIKIALKEFNSHAI